MTDKIDKIDITIYFTGTDKEHAIGGFLWDTQFVAEEFADEHRHSVFSATVSVSPRDLLKERF